ncbi:MAG: hypothetical protein RI883_2332, partial [Bacteroidota bacterium]
MANRTNSRQLIQYLLIQEININWVWVHQFFLLSDIIMDILL